MENASIGGNSLELPPDCRYDQPKHIEARFYMVTIVGSFVALISILENVFLFSMLVTRRHHRNSYALYLLLLAFCDIFVSGAYIPLMSINIMLDYLKSVILLRAWFTYMVPMITISHIALTTGSFLILAASVERYVMTKWPKSRFLNRHRRHIAALAVVLGICTKISVAFELEVIFSKECFGTMNEYQIELSSLAAHPLYNSIWRVWFRNFFTILLPFFLLAFLNLQIVLILRRSGGEFIGEQKLSDAQRKARVRAATRTMGMVVFTYLLSNVVNVIVTIWEYIDSETLQTKFLTFYMFSVDGASLLSIVAAALRLPIYVICQPQLRIEFAIIIKNLCRQKKLQSCPPGVAEDHQMQNGIGNAIKCNGELTEADQQNVSSSHCSGLILHIGSSLMKNNTETELDNNNEDPIEKRLNGEDDPENLEYNNEIDVLL